MVYEHPQYTPESLKAQQRILGLGDGRLAFAGAYHGWGFHEDGALSGLKAAARLGRDWDPVNALSTSAAIGAGAVDPDLAPADRCQPAATAEAP